jgi:hypothetical protein
MAWKDRGFNSEADHVPRWLEGKTWDGVSSGYSEKLAVWLSNRQHEWTALICVACGILNLDFWSCLGIGYGTGTNGWKWIIFLSLDTKRIQMGENGYHVHARDQEHDDYPGNPQTHRWIDEFKGRWKVIESLAPEKLTSLRRIATIESVGSSTRIEGSKLSDAEVEKLLSGLQTKTFASRDEQEVAGYADAMDMIFEGYEAIASTENHIKQLHGVLLKYSDKD